MDCLNQTVGPALTLATDYIMLIPLAYTIVNFTSSSLKPNITDMTHGRVKDTELQTKPFWELFSFRRAWETCV